MRAVFLLVLVAGLGLAGFAVFMVKGYFEEQEQRLAATVETIQVVAVRETVEFGEPILSDNLQVINYPIAHLPEGIFRLSDEPNAQGNRFFVAGNVHLSPEGVNEPRYALRQIEANEPLLVVKLSEPGQETTVVNSLTPGMRAFDIQVSLATGSSSFLRPGDQVDVFWTGNVNVPGSLADGQRMTRLILSNLRIVAVDQSTNRARVASSAPRTVTVEVTSQQVGELSLARETGDLSLALVGAASHGLEVEAVAVDQMSMLDIEVVEEIIEDAPEEIIEAERCFLVEGFGANARITDIEIACAE